ncbi:MAG: ribosome silencing factor [Solirubrobacterales bacterium]
MTETTTPTEIPDGLALAREIAALADAKGATDLVALDVRDYVSYTDVLLVATARNERMAKAIADEVRHQLKQRHRALPLRTEGERTAFWMLMDYGDCVLHVFQPEARERYRLDHLWGEAPQVELELPEPPAQTAASA